MILSRNAWIFKMLLNFFLHNKYIRAEILQSTVVLIKKKWLALLLLCLIKAPHLENVLGELEVKLHTFNNIGTELR
jgi:hypothetical protein